MVGFFFLKAVWRKCMYVNASQNSKRNHHINNHNKNVGGGVSILNVLLCFQYWVWFYRCPLWFYPCPWNNSKNTHTLIHGYHESHSSTPNNSEEFTVSDYVQYCHVYFNSQALSDTSFRGGVEGRWCRSRRERVEGLVEEGKVEKRRRVTIRQGWECKFETLVH